MAIAFIHRYCGMLAPNAPLRSAGHRAAETPAMATPVPDSSPKEAEEPFPRRVARYTWALLRARMYEALLLPCPKCGGEMRIIAFITEAVMVRDNLAHLDEPTVPPRMAPACGPPLWEVPVAGLGGDPPAQAAPDYEFDQRIAW